MRPITLTLCGWGPYKDKQPPIDFIKLKERGLFLITGATGAGKTTIFDAITYALYGDMSGKTREKSSVRSDFADDGTPTYVELLMEHDNKRYHIRRNPEYLRPKKRKTGMDTMTREKENAILTMPDGSHIEGSSEVTRKIQEILHIDLNQFKQLSMIAQGEFTRLLTAQSNEKSKIFREIFDTNLYDKIAGELKHRSSELYKQVMECRSRMQENIELFAPPSELSENWQALTNNKESYYYQEILDFLKTNKKQYSHKLKEQEQKAQEADREVEKLAMLVTEGEQTVSLLNNLSREKKRQETLKSRATEISSEEKKLEKAVKASAVREYENHLNNCCKQRDNLEKKIQDAMTETESIKKRRDEKLSMYEKADELLLAYEKEEEARIIRSELLKLKDSYEIQNKELSKYKEQYLQTEAEEEQQKREYENAEKSYRHGIAGILADGLGEGMPCPVCGSMNHPHKAVHKEESPTEEDVEKKKLLFEEKRKELTVIHGRTTACHERVLGLAEEIEKREQKLAAFNEEQEKLYPFVLKYLKENTKQEFLKEKKDYEALTVRLAEREKRKAELQKEFKDSLKGIKAAENDFEVQRKSCGFASEEDYRRAFMSEKEISDLRSQIQKYKQDCFACRHLIEHLQKELSGRKQANIEELKEKLAEAKTAKGDVYRELDILRQGVTDMVRLYDSLKEKQDLGEKLSGQYGILKDLDDAANGMNSKRLVFEQYVLAAYFEEILNAANLRLHVMTGGRYKLRRVESVGDGRSKDNLEMEVLDYYTGKYRSVKTLSGGETFKVSLSLALGMSDVVQALSGGIRVDTLFIDEGFGALDNESLEQACQTLNSLVEKDRLIGIISHVPELSEKIENQIRVHRTSAGSTVEVVV